MWHFQDAQVLQGGEYLMGHGGQRAQARATQAKLLQPWGVSQCLQHRAGAQLGAVSHIDAPECREGLQEVGRHLDHIEILQRQRGDMVEACREYRQGVEGDIGKTQHVAVQTLPGPHEQVCGPGVARTDFVTPVLGASVGPGVQLFAQRGQLDAQRLYLFGHTCADAQGGQ
ncbi:hypothetical protein WR25_25872 [Diploscapter pachys]|uniref:Uncharacterized protein n=1 Tax=Diploscapter pachys TaxID=2018661 RepID=A0A2A2KAN2_9BILA|nr:hypothetical protein WR25_25872 [Diploscapter pachys]